MKIAAVIAIATCLFCTTGAALADTACVQAELTALGFDPGPVDGQMGRRTQSAASALAGIAGLSLPSLTEATSPDWCTALKAFADTPAAATVFADLKRSQTATPTENTGFQSWSWIGKRQPYAYYQTTLSDAPLDGAFLERFEIRDGDCGSTGNYNDCAHDREHIGWNEDGSTPLDQEVWYSFSLMMPTNEINMGDINTILAEFRPVGPGQINLSIELQKGELVAVVGSTTVEQKNDMEPPPIAKWHSFGMLNPGHWYRFEVGATWSRNESNGRIKIFLQGLPRMDFKGVNTAFNKAVHMQYGLYRPFVSGFKGTVPTQVVYFDNVHKAAKRDALP